MKKRYPRTLSLRANHPVVAISETEVGKIFSSNNRFDSDIHLGIKSEVEKMQFANSINDLVSKFIRIEQLDEEDEMLVMERIYPMDFRAYEHEKRVLWVKTFEEQLKQLHDAGLAHLDLLGLSDYDEPFFDHILLTPKGLRLIDLGISVFKEQVGKRLFSEFVRREFDEFEQFKEYFLSR